VGASFGAVMLGAQIGWLAGSLIGMALFGPDKQKQEGPRLGDRSVQSSAYGQVIPECYGTVRIAGNIIWATEIEEKKSEEEVGGKGMRMGGGTEVTTYKYFGNVAIGFCRGPVDRILRIWADGKIIYDLSGTRHKTKGSGREIKKPGPEPRIYLGTEDQEPDPLIVAHEGEENTPAHRGLCSI